MTNPFAARQKSNAAHAAPTRRNRSGTAVSDRANDPVTSHADRPEALSKAQDLQAPTGGTSAAVPDSASSSAPVPPKDSRSDTGGDRTGSTKPDPGAEPTGEIPPRNRLDDLKKGELVELARRHHIEVADGDTRATLIGKLDKKRDGQS